MLLILSTATLPVCHDS